MILGIDPGVSGALALLTDGGNQVVWVQDMPVRDAGKKARKAHEIDGAALAHLLRPCLADITMACIEEVHAMPGQGVSSMMSLGDSRGCIRGVLEALGISVERVEPATWKRAMGLIGSDKDASRAAAIRIYPTCTDLARKKDHGRAEAILIARYGAQRMRQSENFLGRAA